MKDITMEEAERNFGILQQIVAEIRSGSASHARIGILVLQAYWLGQGMSIEEIIERTENKKNPLTLVKGTEQ